MSQKLLSVVGATGIQGGSVVRAILKAGGYRVRAITRDPESDGSKKLAALGVEVVQADLNDAASLEKAFAGSHVIFAVTNFFDRFGQLDVEEILKTELQQGINLANAAAATPTLEHYIWSTLPNSRKLSNGQHIVPHFDAKNKVDDYIKSNQTLFNKTTFFWVTFYATNFRFPMYTPFRVSTAGPNKYVQLQGTSSSIPMKSMGDAGINVGLFFNAIISQPEKTRGKFVLAHVEDLTAGEFLASWSKGQGKQAQFIHVDKQTYYGLWPMWAEEMDKMHMFWEATQDKSWGGEPDILTKDDLDISGLVSTAVAFAEMKDWE
ncbi:nitrogen metabolic regulation nmr [Trichoderma arundinaceum]|uniref:Nitrogen metabolic regulation nmr n=1 Tax=Trichoderma arundinaceum TaxID=490622 RepID=A0A395NXY8_TRIAR|nr:nitrogen metabolic regulation nmr [Trichoderma arundinaceum]